ncbi:MAG: ATP-dependent Clp protease ATP-binding subunit [Patescibacteria group bacterium]
MSTKSTKFSGYLSLALRRANTLAREAKQATVEPIHLLLALAETRGSLSAELLASAKLDIEALRSFLIEQTTATSTATPLLSADARRALMRATAIAYRAQHTYIGTEHLLQAILDRPGEALRLFRHSHWDTRELAKQLELVMKSDAKLTELTETFIDTATTSDELDELPSVIKGFGTHLTNPERAAAIDPVIGRELEIERVMQILLRRTKNNPVLLGDPGVGKTAIVEGLAKRIAEGNVPTALKGKRIVSLDVGSLIAGTMFRGEFENRIRQVLDELKRNTDIIIFIDELHTIVGAGAATGSIDAANLLKPALARGELRCIGATTLEEYRQHIESDGALERRFQPVRVSEPTPSATRDILHALRRRYEMHHGVRITDEAIDAAIRFSERYLPERFLPDKAIDLIDEAAARAALKSATPALIGRIQEVTAAERTATKRKETATTQERFEEAIRWRDEARDHHARRLELEASFAADDSTDLPTVTAKTVAEILTAWTGVPVRELALDEHARLNNLEASLGERFIGHEHVRRTVSETIRRSSLGLSDRHRPLASFLLAGPTGVGKTTLAKALAQTLFQSEDALLRFDMSEYTEGHTVAKLIGAPAGYVGYKESGALTEAVRRRPYRVILFDELNRAHRDVYQLLLQILSEGSLRDGAGRVISFRQTIIVATMNPLPKEASSLGFGTHNATAASEDILEATAKLLPGELRERFDAVLSLTSLANDELATLLEREVALLNERLAERGVTLLVPDAARTALLTAATVHGNGARSIQHVLRGTVEEALAKRLLARRGVKPLTLALTKHGNRWRLA